MVARIAVTSCIKTTLNYNEKKVQKGVATCIAESGFLLPIDKMNFYHKLNSFEARNSLNQRAKTNTLHVSLNFDPSENLQADKLEKIATDYMQKIGFGDQPFLVYKHNDAGHPHIHIVSTTIKADGSRINTHNIGRNQSETARKKIETIHGLIQAEKQQQTRHILKPVDIGQITYGKTETKNAIAAVLKEVIKSYNYTSLPELNVALRQYNVLADRGSEDGFIHRKHGLLYSLIDSKGCKVGVPIKASSFHGKPTLNMLEQRFAENKLSRSFFKPKLKVKVDSAFANKPHSIIELIKHLENEKIFTVVRQNEEGRLYGITFVDNETRCVLNGSELGKQYSIAGLLKRIHTQGEYNSSSPADEGVAITYSTQDANQNLFSVLVEDLLTPVENFENTPWLLKKKKRKRKNK